MLEGDLDYKFFVTILVIAIIVSLIFHIFFRQNTQASFSEIYYPEPDKLPNEVSIGNKYSFAFSVRNLENKPFTYDYNTKMELFNLYDVTEGLYNCVASQRKKVSLFWKEGNSSEKNKLLLENNNFNNSSFFYTDSDDYGTIDWDNYNIQYAYDNLLESGSFTTAFYGDKEIKYTFTISSDSSEAEFSYLNGSSVKTEKAKIAFLRPSNKVLINVSDTVKYHINDQLLFNTSVNNIDELRKGKVGFRSDDSYVSIGKLVVFKNSPVEVIRTPYIKNYDIDSSPIFDKVRKIRSESEDRAFLISNQTNESAQCVDDDCLALKSFLNDPQDNYEFSSKYTFRDESDLLDLFDAGTSFIPSTSLRQNDTTQELQWPNYTLRMNFQTFVRPHTFLISFDHELFVLFHNSHIFYLTRDDNNTLKLYRRPSRVDIGVNELSIDATNNNNIFYINRIPSINIKKPINFNDVTIATKKTFMVFGNIDVLNKNSNCRVSSISKDCRRIYEVISERQISGGGEQFRAIADPIEISAGLAAAPFLGVAKLLSPDEESKDAEVNNSQVQLPQKFSDLLDYDIYIDPSAINENIPSERYRFNGRNALIRNQNNYSFGYNFYILEGAGLMDTSFTDSEGGRAISFLMNKPKNEAYLLRYAKGGIIKYTAVVNLTENGQHNLDISFESNKTIYSLDRKTIFEFNDTDLSNGYFTISTYNTYTQLLDIRVYDRNFKRYIQYYINSDPCELKKINEEEFDNGNIFLGLNETKTVNQNFSITKNFDYGLVTTALIPESGNSSEIHFWVVRNE